MPARGRNTPVVYYRALVYASHRGGPRPRRTWRTALEAPAAALGPVDPDRVDVLAGLARLVPAAPYRELEALARLFFVSDHVEDLAAAARHVVRERRGPLYLVSARLDKRQGAKFAGVGARAGR